MHGCVPTKLYLQKKSTDGIWLERWSLSTPAPGQEYGFYSFNKKIAFCILGALLSVGYTAVSITYRLLAMKYLNIN